ncbi:ABC transporter permease [Haloimpatiens massiliensis]|uniref:ABC transporter permease n=1 Tax=Haloimpatiens massiliensis TaxID=1658110 RepID=UPI000C819187|nr:FtsX-like permease family protein [Haloimpatiens massiliensis]
MKLGDSIKMSINDLKNRKIRTFLTCFSIGIGVMLIVVMGALGQGLQKWSQQKLNNMNDLKQVSVYPEDAKKRDKLIKENKYSKEAVFKKIDSTTINKIKKINGVDSIRVQFDSNITSTKFGDKVGKKVDIIGVDTNYTIFANSSINSIKNNKQNKNRNTKPIIAGKSLNSTDTTSVLVGERYLNKLGIKNNYEDIIGKEMELKIEIPQQSSFVKKVKIVGVINKLYSDSNSIITPINISSEIQEFISEEKNYLNNRGPSSLVIDAKTINDAKNIYNEVKKTGYSATSKIDTIEYMQKQSQILNVLLMIGGVIVLLVSSIGVINTMTMSVFEKTKSIGIMKALGGSKRNIKTLFIVQSGTIGFFGGILGVILALITSSTVNTLVLNIMKKKGVVDIETLFITPYWLILGSIVLAIFISTIAGIIPAAKASKLDPVESLSYE